MWEVSKFSSGDYARIYLLGDFLNKIKDKSYLNHLFGFFIWINTDLNILMFSSTLTLKKDLKVPNQIH